MPRNYEDFVREVNRFDWDEMDDYDYINDYTEDGTEEDLDDLDIYTEEY